MKATTETKMNAAHYLVHILREAPELTHEVTAQTTISKIMSLIEDLVDYLPSPSTSRVLVLPDDPNDKNSFAIEAMAQAMGLRITTAEVPAERVESLHPKADIVADLAKERGILVIDMEKLTTEKKEFVAEHERLHDLFGKLAPVADYDTPQFFTTSAAPPKHRSNLRNREMGEGVRWEYRDGVKVSLATGKPVRPYRRQRRS